MVSEMVSGRVDVKVAGKVVQKASLSAGELVVSTDVDLVVKMVGERVD